MCESRVRKRTKTGVLCRPFMARQAVRVLLGWMPLTATAYPLRVHHERRIQVRFSTACHPASSSDDSQSSEHQSCMPPRYHLSLAAG